jgi:hypothetical protein
MNLFWRKPQVSVHEKFWKWFLKNETKLLNFEADQEATFNNLSAALSSVDPDLTFEFGPPMPKREFVISAGGIKRAFPAVVALAGAAPKLPNWQVTAFRPRRTTLNLIELGGIHVDPNEVQFSLLDNGEKAGVYLFKRLGNSMSRAGWVSLKCFPPTRRAMRPDILSWNFQPSSIS